MTTVAIIGGGKMGEALFAGLRSGGHQVVICEADDARAQYLTQLYGDVVVGREAAADVDAVIVAVKPPSVPSVIADLPLRSDGTQVLMSIAAGVATSTLIDAASAAVDVVRVMPNTPVLVGEGMSVLSPAPTCSAPGLALARELMACVGDVEVLAEVDQDAVTAISGSGPAYLFLVVEAMTDAGTALGLAPDVAQKLAVQTAVGAAAMLSETGVAAAQLRANVTSPGGTTAAAVEVLEEHNLRETFALAMKAARDRSLELGQTT